MLQWKCCWYIACSKCPAKAWNFHKVSSESAEWTILWLDILSCHKNKSHNSVAFYHCCECEWFMRTSHIISKNKPHIYILSMLSKCMVKSPDLIIRSIAIIRKMKKSMAQQNNVANELEYRLVYWKGERERVWRGKWIFHTLWMCVSETYVNARIGKSSPTHTFSN